MKKYDKKYSSTYHLYICNSKFTQNWLHKYWNIPQEKSSVLYPAIEPIAKKYHFDFDKLDIVSTSGESIKEIIRKKYSIEIDLLQHI